MEGKINRTIYGTIPKVKWSLHKENIQEIPKSRNVVKERNASYIRLNTKNEMKTNAATT